MAAEDVTDASPGGDLEPAGRAERRELLRAAAIEAELVTGRRELTEERARRHVVVRLALVVLGTLVTLSGLAMLVLPGPGLVVVIAGLGILSTEVAWAERLLAYAKNKANLDQVTAQRPWIKPVSIAVTVIACAISIAYLLGWIPALG